LLGSILLLWQILAATYSSTAFFIGSPVLVGRILWEYTMSGELPSHMLQTTTEALCGFIWGVVAGCGVGFSFWYWPTFAELARPYIKALSTIPVFVLAPLIIVWFGIGMDMKIILSGSAVFLISLAGAYEGTRAVSEREYLSLRLYGASRLQILRVYVIPTSISYVFASMRMSIGVAILGAFIGEFISANSGLGYFMVKNGSLYNIPAVLAGAVYLLLLSSILNIMVGYLDKYRLQILNRLS
jgi:NitT/TauT family transport system permease protein